jgi:hypothetical protein
MKRYLVFSGSEYYPSGGWMDFIDDFDDIEKARVRAIEYAGEHLWYHIVDTTIKKEIE